MFGTTVMGFRKRMSGQEDRWEYFNQYCVYHTLQDRCVTKRGKKCEYPLVHGALTRVITENPMDSWSDISRENYSKLLPSQFRQNVDTGIQVSVAVAFIAFLTYLLKNNVPDSTNEDSASLRR